MGHAFKPHRFKERAESGGGAIRTPDWMSPAQSAPTPLRFPRAKGERSSSLPPPRNPSRLPPRASQFPPGESFEGSPRAVADGPLDRHETLPPPSTTATAEEVAGLAHAPRPPQLDTPPPGSGSILPPPGVVPQIGGFGGGAAAIDGAIHAAREAEHAAQERGAAFAQAALEMAAARNRMAAEIEAQALDLAIDIAGAIVEKEVEHDPEIHRAFARAALSSLGDLTHVKLRASREAYAAIMDAFGNTSVEIDGTMIHIQLDPTLEGLGCIAENEHVRVDGRLPERLRNVRRAIQEERRRRTLETIE